MAKISGRVKWVIGIAGTLFVVLLVVRYFAVPRYSFDFSSLSDPKDLRQIAQLDAQLERIDSWQSKASDPNTIRAVVGLMQTPVNRKAGRFRELIRTGDDAHLLTVNTALMLLDKQIDKKSFKSIRELSREEAQRRLQSEFQTMSSAGRNAALDRLLMSEETKRLLQRIEASEFPKQANGRSVFWNMIAPSSDDQRKQWLEQFHLETASNVKPVVAWYQDVAAKNVFQIGPDDKRNESRLLLIRTDEAKSIRFDRFDTKSNMSIWYSSPPRFDHTTTFNQRVDTGVRLFDVSLVPGTTKTKVSKVGIDWPVEEPMIDRTQFNLFLRLHGYPSAFGARKILVETTGTAPRPIVKIIFEAYHRDVESCSWRDSLELDSGSPDQVTQRVIAIRNRAQNELSNSLNELKNYRGTSVIVHNPDKKDNCRSVSINVQSVGHLHFTLSTNEDGFLCWSGQPSVEESKKLIKLISRKVKTLHPVAPLLTIDSLRLEMAPIRITGRVGIKGTLVGLDTDLKNLESHISPDGEVFLQLRRNDIKYLNRIGKASEFDYEKTKFSKSQINKLLRKNFHLLGENLKLVSLEQGDFGQLATLSLNIADWPQIRLGPTRLRSHEPLAQQIETILSSESVTTAADEQWNRGARHPRYGLISSQLTNWSTRNAKGEIRCSLKFESAGYDLPWSEPVSHSSDGWTKLSSKEICRALYSKRKELERQLEQAIYTSTGADLSLRLEDDAFGPGQWLRLSPPGVKARAEMRVPFTRVRVGVGDMLVESDKIHWPESIPITLETTFYTTSFCVSDPSITATWKKLGLSFAAKMTPPMIPLKGSKAPPLESYTPDQQEELLSEFGLEDESTFRLRLDNPWLHLIYLKGEFGGQLRDPSLQVEGAMTLLDYIDAARIVGEGRLEPAAVEAWMEARPVPELESFPSLEGEMLLSSESGFRMRIRALLGVYTMQGWLRVDTNTRPMGLALSGVVNLPVIGQASVEGHSDFRFENYEVNAHGQIPFNFPWGTKILNYDFHADPVNTVFTFWWVTPTGQKIFFAMETRTGEPDNKRLEKELGAAIKASAGNMVRQPDSEEAELIAQAAEMKLNSNPKNSSSSKRVLGTDVRVDGNATQGKPQKLPDSDLRLEINKETLVVGSISNAFPELKLSRSELPFSAIEQAHYGLYLYPRNSNRFALMVADVVESKCYLLDISGPSTISGHEDLTPRLTETAERFFDAVKTGNDTERLVSGTAIMGYVYLKLLEAKPTSPTRLANGIVVDFHQNTSDLASDFYWPGDHGVHCTTAGDDSIGSSEFHELCRNLSTKSTPSFFGTVIARESLPQSDKSSARVAWFPLPEKQSFRLYWDLLGDWKNSHVVELVGDSDTWQTMLRSYLQLQWKDKLVPHNKVMIGPEGLALLSNDGLWLMSSVPNHDSQQAPLFLSKETFEKWPDTSLRLLPPKWQDRSHRHEMKLEELARTLLVDWQALRKRSRWGANPLGLVLRLARSANGSPSVPVGSNGIEKHSLPENE